MAEVVQRTIRARPKETSATAEVKHAKDGEIMSETEKFREKFQRTVLRPEPNAILEERVTDWKAIWKRKFIKYKHRRAQW